MRSSTYRMRQQNESRFGKVQLIYPNSRIRVRHELHKCRNYIRQDEIGSHGYAREIGSRKSNFRNLMHSYALDVLTQPV